MSVRMSVRDRRAPSADRASDRTGTQKHDGAPSSSGAPPVFLFPTSPLVELESMPLVETEATGTDAAPDTRAAVATALPHAMSDDDILAEFDAAQGRGLAEAVPAPVKRTDVSYVVAIGMLRGVQRCSTCGKTRVVVNVAPRGRPFRAERVSPALHCLCPGSPVLAYVRPDGDSASAIPDDAAVEFDGERTTWGALLAQDRKTVTRGADGVLRGGYGY